jgi:uncharacterized protein YceK
MFQIFNRLSARASCLVLVTMILIGASGCAVVVGSDHADSNNPTVGRQLQDLKVARDKGAISEPEYEQAKSKVLSQAQ